ncbi:MAG: carbohydrate-binding family 9-like protein [Candidatus Hydrogenedentes bacterium]|nr:carbohydrate-binding family 9-like protein [Candidatus Hydrogenedentota bacterium]
MYHWAYAALALSSLLIAAPSSDEHPLLALECPKATGGIAVDGQGNEPAWKDVKAITDFRLWNPSLGKPTESTELRMCHDDTNVYALFVCTDPDVFALHEGRDAMLWESDCVELFFVPDANSPIYYEFEVSPRNDVFDARIVNSGSGGFRRWAPTWNCGMRTAATVRGTLNDWRDTDEGFTVEMAIPIEAFADANGTKPLAGQTWQFAAARMDFSKTLKVEERSSTANVPDMNIHKREGWFTLTFK